MKIIIIFIALKSIGMSLSNDNSGDIDYTKLKFKVAKAVRISSAPKIDGIIDEVEWSNSIANESFLQQEPYNLADPTVRTQSRVMYDDNFLYVAFNNFDPNPEKIMALTGKRDDWSNSFGNNSDWIGIGIDSNNDDKTGNWFAVNASGVQLDVSISGQDMRSFDNTWNAVWESAVQIHSEGWSAEIKIPFNVFQFSDEDVQTWGIMFGRGYYSNQENIRWPGWYNGYRGFVPHYGVLEGIRDIPQQKNVEFVPYLLGGQTENISTETTQNLGLDIRYNVSSNTTLNMTFNPDFGQVQADPSVLNLSAFETRLEERRPFFVRGGNFFRNRLNIFNSRRIGSRPSFYSPEKGELIDRPDATTILSAAKVLGETSSGLRYGIINAVTNEEYATNEFEDVNGQKISSKFLVEPYANYFVGRVEKPIINDLSTIGFMTTNLNRQKVKEEASAYNLDWSLNLLDNRLSFEGQAAVSNNESTIGHAARFSGGYRDPNWWEWRFWGGFRNEDFDVSKMGFQEKNNVWSGGTRFGMRRDRPKGIFLDQNLDVRWSFGGRGSDERSESIITRNNLNINNDNNLMNYWGLGWDMSFSAEVFEDDDLYRDDRALVVKDNAWQNYRIWFSTDRRKKIILKPSFQIDKGELRDWGNQLALDITIKPTDFINLRINTSYEHKPVAMQWVGIVERLGSDNFDIVYSDMLRKQFNTEYRLNIAFSSKMTFEAYYQPFEVDVDYDNYGRLLKERSFDLEPYDYSGDKDFRIKNNVGTFVFRWEYLPGSLFYAVYNLSDNNYYTKADGWEQSKSNSLFIKIDRFFRL